MKVLLVIASFGTANDQYLSEVINEYRSMPYEIDIVVVSNISKFVAPGVRTVVGLPTRNPRSLPFAHKQILAEHVDAYDLFIYSEDDILIRSANIEAFMAASRVVLEDEIPGFLRIEKDQSGEVYFPDIHHRFHWDPKSVRRRGDDIFAFFTNEHAGCYLLTQQQLKRIIHSDRFVVNPHEGRYDMLETAATDPYTQCGCRKVICISNLENFVVHHLPNKYVGKLGVPARDVYPQIQALLDIAKKGQTGEALINPQPEALAVPFSASYSKNFYEPVRSDLRSLIPSHVRSVISVGCGWGATEEWLEKQGLKVVALPLDPVISACVAARGIEVVRGDVTTARKELDSQRFDCLLISNIIHLAEDPENILSRFVELLSENSVAIVIVPNILNLPDAFRHIRRRRYFRDWCGYRNTGVHLTSRYILRRWCKRAGLNVQQIAIRLPENMNKSVAAKISWMRPLFGSELIAIAEPLKKTSRSDHRQIAVHTTC